MFVYDLAHWRKFVANVPADFNQENRAIILSEELEEL